MRDLTGMVAIVTGASRGLGPFIARALAREGANLVLAARSAEELRALAAELGRQGARAVAVPTDVADPRALEDLADAAHETFGAVDILVNNAGIGPGRPFDQLDAAELERLVRVNLTAPLLLARMVLPHMLERGRGHIVNISSLAGKAGPPLREPYAATKAGLIGFTRSLRASYRHLGVSASVIVPGFIRGAGMHADAQAASGAAEPHRVGTSAPEAVAAAVVRAIRRDLPEVIVAQPHIHALVRFLQPFPSAIEWVVKRAGVREMYRARGRP